MTYLAVVLGVVSRAAFYVPSSVPTFVSTYLATQDLRAVALAAINVLIATAIYYPFVRAYERHSGRARGMIERLCDRFGIEGELRDAALAAYERVAPRAYDAQRTVARDGAPTRFSDEGIAESDLAGTTGYGYDDAGARALRIAARARLRRGTRAGAALDRERHARDRGRDSGLRSAGRPTALRQRSPVRYAAQRDLRCAALARRARGIATRSSR